jgi:dihydrofolate reductase
VSAQSNQSIENPIDGRWEETWRGWWGDEPPYHAPVFVLRHHSRKPRSMQDGTTFTFVIEGIDSALEQVRAAAGEIASPALTHVKYRIDR